MRGPQKQERRTVGGTAIWGGGGRTRLGGCYNLGTVNQAGPLRRDRPTHQKKRKAQECQRKPHRKGRSNRRRERGKNFCGFRKKERAKGKMTWPPRNSVNGGLRSKGGKVLHLPNRRSRRPGGRTVMRTGRVGPGWFQGTIGFFP